VATIQVRDIPQDAFETLRRRARSEGRSIQAYMRERIVEMAAAPSKAEHMAVIEEALACHGGADITAEEIAADLAAERR
jgi:plasmid stability protein